MKRRRAGVMAAEVLRHVTKKPATISYPFTPVKMPDRFRGKITFVAEKCVGCKLCVKDCPANAIAINKVGDKRFEAVFELDRCIYCAQCVDSCRKDALLSSVEFELAAGSRSVLRAVFAAPPAPATTPTKDQKTETEPASNATRDPEVKSS